MAVAFPERKSPTKRTNIKPVMVATQGLGEQLVLRDGKLDGQGVQVLLDTRSGTSTAKASLMAGRGRSVALVPDVPVVVILASSDHSPTAEVNSLVTTRAQRRWQLQEMTKGEVEATPSNSVQVTEDLEVEEEGGDNPVLARGPVSEYPDWAGRGKQSSWTLSRVPPRILTLTLV